MKLIHCADLHLDSPMESNLSAAQAKERKNEILGTFAGLVRRAAQSGVAAILISGDLFDSRHITKKTEKYVLDLIRGNPDLFFFYLAGNHDQGSTLLRDLEADPDAKPENLCFFGDGWRSYEFGDVVITGSEHPDPATLRLDPDRFNIVMLHGQEESSNRKTDRAEIIPFPKYKSKGIDYLALGHLHAYREAQIDSRCTACYPGCLEGRGFDECGKKGFVLLEIEGGKLQNRTFVPIARRELYAVTADLTGAESLLEMEARVRAAVDGISRESLVKVTLTGQIPAELNVDTGHLSSVLTELFYFAKLEQKTGMLIRPEDYRNDISLKGEFVRRVLDSDLTEEEKERVLACGFRALCGEEIGF